MPQPIKKPGTKKGQAVKWATKKSREAACERYCKHIKSGYSKDSWPDADFETVERYKRDYPEDFCPDKIKQAERESLRFWEGIGISGTVGKIKGFNAQSWKFNMQNRAGWTDKSEQKIDSNINFVKIDDLDEQL